MRININALAKGELEKKSKTSMAHIMAITRRNFSGKRMEEEKVEWLGKLQS